MNNELQSWEFERDRYTIEHIKATLTLASGTLIVSLGIINTKIPLSYKGVLYISWLLLINSIIFGLWAIKAGILRYNRAVEGTKGRLKANEKELYEKGRVLTKFEAETPNIQTWSFILGLVGFFLFVILNTYLTIKW